MSGRTGLRVAIALAAAYNLALGLYQVIAPHSFYKQIGPFGPYNPHYIRDNATYALALGATLVAALWLSRWRVPLLALSVLQFVLHTINHLVDIDKAHPHSKGVFDFVSLLVGTFVLGGLLWVARREEQER
jgi:hypothetical protein